MARPNDNSKSCSLSDQTYSNFTASMDSHLYVILAGKCMVDILMSSKIN